MGNQRSSHIYGLDGLRAIAIIGVTLFHMFPDSVEGGYLGTSLFFVLSGFLVAVTTEARMDKDGFRVMSYYGKRIKRIYPALLLVLLITVGVYYFINSEALGGIRPEMLSVVGGYDNWWQITQNADYFSKIANASPFTHLWFLSIEMQFYLIWPLIVMIVYRVLARRRGSRMGLIFMLVVTVASAVESLLLYHPEVDVTRIYYGTDTRLYALTFGVILGMLFSSGGLQMLSKRLIAKLALPLFVSFLALTVVAYIWMNGQMEFTYRGGMILMTLVFGGLLMLTVDQRLRIGELLDIGPLSWIGKRSYELYLWQYPVIFLFMNKGWVDEYPWLYLVEGIVLLGLAAFLHFVTESLMKKRLNPGFIAAALASVALSVAGVIGFATADTEKPGKMDELAAHLEEQQQMLADLEQQDDENWVSSDVDPDGDDNVSGSAVSGDSVDEEEEEKEIKQPKLKYGDLSLTNSAPVSKKHVYMVGDSILLSASRAVLKELPGAKIDAQQNRMVGAAVDVVKQAVKDGKIHKSVVIALGTNGRITMDTAEEIIDILGDDVSIFWVNLFGRTVLWRREANSNLKKLAEKHSNFSVINWYDVIKDKKDEWLWPDGDHPNYEGEKVYSRLIRESLEAARYNQKVAEQQNGESTDTPSGE